MYQFEKMFRDNDVKENDPELPRAIAGKIEKFRAIQQEITAHPEDKEGNQKRKTQLDEIDEQIMKTLPDFFEIEDEAETIKKQKQMEKQQKLDERAAKAGLPKGSTEEDIVKAEKKAKEDGQKREALDKRAAKVGLPAGSSEADIEKAEKTASDAEAEKNSNAQKREALDKRALAVGLAAGASEADIKAAEDAVKKKKDDEENAPASSDAGALEKLHKKGKTSVTKTELKAAGFNTGFWGPIGPHGCTKGAYRIYRDNPESETFSLSKIG